MISRSAQHVRIRAKLKYSASEKSWARKVRAGKQNLSSDIDFFPTLRTGEAQRERITCSKSQGRGLGSVARKSLVGSPPATRRSGVYPVENPRHAIVKPAHSASGGARDDHSGLDALLTPVAMSRSGTLARIPGATGVNDAAINRMLDRAQSAAAFEEFAKRSCGASGHALLCATLGRGRSFQTIALAQGMGARRGGRKIAGEFRAALEALGRELGRWLRTVERFVGWPQRTTTRAGTNGRRSVFVPGLSPDCPPTSRGAGLPP